MKHKKLDNNQAFIGIYPEAFPLKSCKLVIDEFEKALSRKDDPKSPHTIKYSEHEPNCNKKIRADISLFANESMPELHTLVGTYLKEAVQKYYAEFFILDGIGLSSYETKIQKTEPRGGYHIWHCENDRYSVADRVLAWTIYLNDVIDGEGETEFLWQGIKIKPKAGTICIFPAAFTHMHRGNPIYTQNKYIVTGWFTHVR